MLINVKYMGLLALNTNISEEQVEFDGVTVRAFLEFLYEKYGDEFKDTLVEPGGAFRMLVTVNSQAASYETMLYDGDKISFLVIVHGG